MKQQRSNDTEPRYVISVVAHMLDMQTHTLRYYERIGIIAPCRSRGNIRLYSERDVELLRRVRSLVEGMGVNLAGVEVILRLMRRMNQLQNELERAEEQLMKLRGR